MRYYRVFAFALSLALVATVVAAFSLNAAPAGGRTVLLALKARTRLVPGSAVPQRISPNISSQMSRPGPPGQTESADELSQQKPNETEPDKDKSRTSAAGGIGSTESIPDSSGIPVNRNPLGGERNRSSGDTTAGDDSATPPGDGKSLAEVLANYHARLVALIEAKKSYPQVARRLRHQGIVQVSFTLAADGKLAGLAVSDSSGHGELDEAALGAVRAVPQFPAFPTELGTAERRFAVSLSFVLE